MEWFSQTVDRINAWVGTPLAVTLTVAAVVVDLIAGLAQGGFNNWGNVNGALTGLISIILLVLLQHSANRGNAATHLKLDQLVLHDERMDNRVVASEDLSEAALRSMKAEAVEQVKTDVDETMRGGVR